MATASNAAPEAKPAQTLRERQWAKRAPAASVSGYSRWVKTLRILLPVSALGVLAAVFFWPATQQEKIVPLPAELPQVTMEKPHFSGTDNANQPFSITANRAQQLPQRLAVVDLEALEATMALNSGTKLSGAAKIGRFDQEKRRLWLGGDVQINDSRGNRFAAPELNVDIPANIIWTDKPVRVAGTFGTIEGEGFRSYHGGKLVMITGRSKAVLNAGADSASVMMVPNQ
jgi:lipopolysaccharide export system protein LptC